MSKWRGTGVMTPCARPMLTALHAAKLIMNKQHERLHELATAALYLVCTHCPRPTVAHFRTPAVPTTASAIQLLEGGRGGFKPSDTGTREKPVQHAQARLERKYDWSL